MTEIFRRVGGAQRNPPTGGAQRNPRTVVRHRRTLRAIAGVFLFSVTTAHAAESPDKYPSRPVRIVTGSTGSTSDAIARFTAQKLTERLGQQFIVDNRAGAGGTI